MLNSFDEGPEGGGMVATADLGGARGRPTDATALDATRRIFVNRNLRFDSIRWVGFDMDHTLARYHRRATERLAFRLTAERLVRRLGYPEEVLEIPYDPHFVLRGLVVDKKQGNLLKMDRHGHVGRVYHGHRLLPREARTELYRSAKIRLASKRYHWLDTLFALPEASLYASMIDLYELRLGIERMAFEKVFDDIRTSIDGCHRDGTLKTIVKANLSDYIIVDSELPPTLHKLRSSNKRLFVLTNSEWDYTDAVMSFMLDGKLPEYPTWRSYFDYVIVGAQKPHFFMEHRPFTRLDPDREGRPMSRRVDRIEARGVYAGGSIRELERLVPSGDQTLYVGDHIYGDIIRSKRDTLWRTALIVEELEPEMARARELLNVQSDLEALEEHRGLLEHDVRALRLQLMAIDEAIASGDAPQDELSSAKKVVRLALDRKRRDLKAVNERREHLTADMDRAFNPNWGSLFKEGGEVSRFGAQVESYACIYTSRVSNFLAYSPAQYFRAPRHWMPHEKA